MRPTHPRPLALTRKLRHFYGQLPMGLSLRQQKNRLVKFLHEQGFEKLGSGSFGCVMGYDTQAVKLVLADESCGYLAYARFCRAFHLQNRLLPRVHAVHRVGPYALVFMERLCPRETLSSPLCPTLRRASRNGEHVNCASRLIGRTPASLKQALDKVHAIVNSHADSFLDIRSDNILFRREKGQMKMVLLDPVAY